LYPWEVPASPMPELADLSRLSLDELRTRHTELRTNLVATSVLVRHVATALREPTRLQPAADLIKSTLAILDLPGARGREEILREVNLSNATLAAVIDLVRSHADVPRAPKSK